MMTWSDFEAKKIIVVFPKFGDKLSFRNDNLVVNDFESHIKLQVSCFRIFAIFVVGGFSITTGLVEKSKKFGFSIVLFTNYFKIYEMISYKLQGNTLLRQKQYECVNSNEIAKKLIINKIKNQRDVLKQIRDLENKIAIESLNRSVDKLQKGKFESDSIMGIEGAAAKVYFKRLFNDYDWNGRQPRVKRDRTNLLLDIGYTIFFNYIEALLNIYGFDIYKGNLHKDFYMRKSLVCDIIEPFRPIVDYKIRKCYNLGIINKYDFFEHNGQYGLDEKNNSDFLLNILKEINSYKKCIFDYVQSYYRWVMKGKSIDEFPEVKLIRNDIN